MTDPDPDKRPQRARDVVALLAKSKPPPTSSDARSSRRTVAAQLAPRRMFSDVHEPLGTLLRLGVLGFGAGGWVGMAASASSLAITIGIIAVLAFPARGARVRVAGSARSSTRCSPRVRAASPT